MHDAAASGKAGEGKGDDDNDDDEDDDIEAAIRKEVAALNAERTGADGAGSGSGSGSASLLAPVKLNVDCLLFVKTRPPVDPVAFVRRICEDARRPGTSASASAPAAADPSQFRCRYVNRLTPVSVTGKATEQGLVEIARKVLAPFFDLSGKRSGAGVTGDTAPPGEEKKEAGEREGGQGQQEQGQGQGQEQEQPTSEAAGEKKAEEPTDNNGPSASTAANAETKPFTVSPVPAVCRSHAMLSLGAVCDPTEHPQPQQPDARRCDQHGRRAHQQRAP